MLNLFRPQVDCEPTVKDIEDNAQYLEVDPVSGEWAIQYAREQLEAVQRSIESTDAKAESIIKYCAAIVPIAAVAATLGVASAGFQLLAIAVPAVFGLVLGLVGAMEAIAPRQQTDYPAICQALSTARQFGRRGEALFCRNLVPLQFELDGVLNFKGLVLRKAFRALAFVPIWSLVSTIALLGYAAFRTILLRHSGPWEPISVLGFRPLSLYVVGLAGVGLLALYRLVATATPVRRSLDQWIAPVAPAQSLPASASLPSATPAAHPELAPTAPQPPSAHPPSTPLAPS